MYHCFLLKIDYRSSYSVVFFLFRTAWLLVIVIIVFRIQFGDEI